MYRRSQNVGWNPSGIPGRTRNAVGALQMIWHREHVDIVECVTHAQRSRRAINDLAERNADGADINDLAESLLLTEKKHITTSPDYDRLIPVPYKLLFDPL
jgi:Zn ribbon nucleic-acid-binding protein